MDGLVQVHNTVHETVGDVHYMSTLVPWRVLEFTPKKKRKAEALRNHASGVYRYSPKGADDIRMYISPQASYTFNDIPSLRLG